MLLFTQRGGTGEAGATRHGPRHSHGDYDPKTEDDNGLWRQPILPDTKTPDTFPELKIIAEMPLWQEFRSRTP